MEATTRTTYSLQCRSGSGFWFDVNASVDLTVWHVAEAGYGKPGLYRSESRDVEDVRAYHKNVLGGRQGYRIVEKASTWTPIEL
jgi:hypothetical protein